MENGTKNGLAQAIKLLMSEKAFDKITIEEICEKCGKNRKTFYYHFKDKYDLVNWIFNAEFQRIAQDRSYETVTELMVDICEYLYNNRSFYRKALYIEGQNSFSDHFREILRAIIMNQLQDILHVGPINEFQINFFTDSYVMSFQRWLVDYPNMGPMEFLNEIKTCIKYMAVGYPQIE